VTGAVIRSSACHDCDFERARETIEVVVFHQHVHLLILCFACPVPIPWKQGAAQALDIDSIQPDEPVPHRRLLGRVRVHRRGLARPAELLGGGGGRSSLPSVGLRWRFLGATSLISATELPVIQAAGAAEAGPENVIYMVILPPITMYAGAAGYNRRPFDFSTNSIIDYPSSDASFGKPAIPSDVQISRNLGISVGLGHIIRE
jgi:hypothetical protein